LDQRRSEDLKVDVDMATDPPLAEGRPSRQRAREHPGPGPHRAEKRRRAPFLSVTAVGVGIALMLTSTGLFIGGKLLADKVESSVNRDDLLGDAAPIEPPKITGPFTFLVMGSDSRAGDNFNPETPDGSVATVPGVPRTDSIIMVHVPRSTDRAYVISIPRDTYLPIADSKGRRGARNKVNAAFVFGGAPRLVQTLDRFTGHKIDYPVLVDFSAVREITDLVGGVDVVIDRESHDAYRFLPANSRYPTTPCRDTRWRKRNCLTFRKGPLHLDGQLAEYYVRQRTGLANGDLDRAKRQQQFLRALLSKAASGGLLTNPRRFNDFITVVGAALTVDDRMPVSRIAFSLKGLRPSDLVFMTLPTAGFDTVPGVGSVVLPDVAQSSRLFAAMNAGTMEDYLLKYPAAANDVSHGP
jgi:LCP family protein required for cell wall assembly